MNITRNFGEVMLRRNKRDFALLARVVQNSKCQARDASDKSSRVRKLLKVKLEERMLFGKLAETKKQKNKRMKLEAKGELPKVNPSFVDAELQWAMASSSNFKRISKKPVLPETQANQDSRIHSPSSCDNQDIPEIAAKDKCKVLTDSIGEVASSKLEANVKKSVIELIDSVKDVLEFPMFVNYKESDKWTSESEIMTVSPMQDRDCLKYPSVTKILNATMSEDAKAVLEKWKARMIEKFGFRGFELYQKELFAEGKLLHSTIMDKLIQKPQFEVPDKIQKSFHSLDDVLKNIDEVRALESHVIHPTLIYRGILDCVAVYRGDLCMIDWKKSDKAKDSIANTYDAPLQLSSYVGALNADSKYPFQIKKGIIVVAYTNGDPAKVHEISEDSLKSYWKLWLQRLQNYHTSMKAS